MNIFLKTHWNWTADDKSKTFFPTNKILALKRFLKAWYRQKLFFQISWDLLFFKEEFYYIELNIIKNWFNVKKNHPIVEPEQPWELPSVYCSFRLLSLGNTKYLNVPFPTDNSILTVTKLHLLVRSSSTLIFGVKIWHCPQRTTQLHLYPVSVSKPLSIYQFTSSF